MLQPLCLTNKWLYQRILLKVKYMRESRGGGGLGVRTPLSLENQKAVGFLRNTCTSLSPILENYILQCRDITGPPAKRHLNGVSLAGRWWSALFTRDIGLLRNTGTTPLYNKLMTKKQQQQQQKKQNVKLWTRLVPRMM